MATNTPTRPLEDVLRERWTTGTKAAGIATDDAVEDAMRTVLHAMVDPGPNNGYYQWPEDDLMMESPRVGEPWIAGLTAAVQNAARTAFEAHVVPVIARTVIEWLPDAPHRLINHPEAEVLRADLAALAGADR